MNTHELKQVRLLRRKRRVRKHVYGTVERPRLSVYRSLKNIYAQIIDDDRGVTICQASSRDRELREQMPGGGNKTAASAVGRLLAERARAAGIEQVALDRNGRKYHGRLAALAEAVREAGLRF